MNIGDQAVAHHIEGFNCAQSVLAAYSDSLGLDKETALKVAAAFGAGMGCTAKTCGAVTGALMVLGLRCGKAVADPEAKKQMNGIAREFMERFQARNNSLLCRELLGIDVSLPGGMAAVRAQGLSRTICDRLIRDAVEIVAEMTE